MKKRLLPAIAIGMAVLIIGSIAYAADRRKNTKTVDRLTDKTREEEALRAEFLESLEQREVKPHRTDNAKTDSVTTSNDNKDDILLAEFARK
ncbi:MAG: hypothetical protein PHY09_17465 [Desulfuromonadaceae bacterium]|nr:hypothetical protein [Desulfuromonadaceae bacterium]MDD5107668.1 hypothetical protein [Desulfuromonadaceae bacterium]